MSPEAQLRRAKKLLAHREIEYLRVSGRRDADRAHVLARFEKLEEARRIVRRAEARLAS